MRPMHLAHGETRHLWRLAAYSALATPLSIMIIPAVALVPIYYTGTFGLNLALVGVLMLFARLFDAVTDPIVGTLSDRTQTKYGRRRPWIACGAPVLLVGVWLLFAPPVQPSALYLLIVSMVTYLGWTMIQIPYWSWGAEIGKGYDDRTTVSGFRESAMIFGIVLASIAPVLASWMGHGIDRFTMLALAILVTVTLTGGLLLTLNSFSEDNAKSQIGGTWSEILTILRANRPFRRLVSAFAIIEFGKGAAVAVTPYLLTHYFQQPELIGLVLLVPYIFLILSAPLWLKISKRIGKHRAVAYSLGLSAAILTIGVIPLGPGDGMWFLVVECIVGFAAGGFGILPYAIVADTADFYADKSGGDALVGTHFSAWSLIRKLMLALSVGVALPLLVYLGFDPNAEIVSNTRATKWTFLVLAMPFYLIGAALMINFPLTKKTHDAIRARLEARNEMEEGKSYSHAY